MKREILCLLALLCLLPAAAGAQDDRVGVGNDIVIEEGETVGDIVCVGCSIEIRGSVAGDAVTVGGDLEILGSVGNDAVAVFGSSRLRPGASVGNDAVAVFGRVEADPGATIGGETVSQMALPVGGLAGLILFVFLLSLLTHVILVLLTFLIAGQPRVEAMVETLRTRPGASVLTGLGLSVGFAVLCVVAAFMGPAAPLVYVMAALAFVVTLLVGYTALSYWMGRLLAKTAAPVVAVLLGVLVITLVQLVPLVFPVLALLALGTAVLSGFGSTSGWPAGGPSVPPPPSASA